MHIYIGWLLIFLSFRTTYSDCGADQADNDGDEDTIQIPIKRDLTNVENVVKCIDFESADLLAPYRIEQSTVQLEAFKVGNSQDQWVSLGYPTFLKNRDDSFYEYTPDSITIQIELLDENQRTTLENAAKSLHPKIQKPVVSQLPLQGVSCSTKFFYNDEEFFLNGHVHDFESTPFTLDVPCPEASPLRKSFRQRINGTDDLRWNCLFRTGGTMSSINVVTLPGEFLEKFSVEKRILGLRRNAYVTKKQLKKFARDLRIEFNNEQVCDLDDKSDGKILLRLITSNVEKSFQSIPIEPALEGLSDMLNQHKVSPAETIKRLQNIFVVRPIGKVDVIGVSDEYSSSTSAGVVDPQIKSAGLMHLGIDLQASVDVVMKSQEKWKKGRHSVQQQLDEINRLSRDGIQWRLDTVRLQPKTMTVAAVSQRSIRKSIQIAHRKSYVKSAAFTRNFVVTPAGDELGGSSGSNSSSSNEDFYSEAVALAEDVRKTLDSLNIESASESSGPMEDIYDKVKASADDITALKRIVNGMSSTSGSTEATYAKLNATAHAVMAKIEECGEEAKRQITTSVQPSKPPVQTTLQSYRTVCKEFDGGNDNARYEGSAQNYLAATYLEYHEKNYHFFMDDIRCSAFGDDYFLQNVNLDCHSLEYAFSSSTYRYFSKHCYQCCHNEFTYNSAPTVI